MLIENSTNSENDVGHAMAVTLTGIAEITDEVEKKSLSHAYLAKHPYLEGFIKSNTCAFIKLQIEQYVLVENFQDVSILDVT